MVGEYQERIKGTYWEEEDFLLEKSNRRRKRFLKPKEKNYYRLGRNCVKPPPIPFDRAFSVYPYSFAVKYR